MTTHAISKARHSRLVAGLAATSPTAPPAAVLRTIGELSGGLDAEALTDLAARLKAIPLRDESAADVELTWAHIRVRTTARSARVDISDDVFGIPYERLIVLGKSRGARAEAALADWFAWSPNAESVVKVITGIARPPRDGERDALRKWFKRATRATRRETISELAGDATETGQAWVAEFVQATRDYDEEQVVREIVVKLMAVGAGKDRVSLIQSLIALSPSIQAAQREVGELVIWLLNKGTKIDFDNAALAVSALGERHRMGRLIASAFRSAASAGDWKVPNGREPDFRAAKISLPKSVFKKKSKWRRTPGR